MIDSWRKNNLRGNDGEKLNQWVKVMMERSEICIQSGTPNSMMQCHACQRYFLHTAFSKRQRQDVRYFGMDTIPKYFRNGYSWRKNNLLRRGEVRHMGQGTSTTLGTTIGGVQHFQKYEQYKSKRNKWDYVVMWDTSEWIRSQNIFGTDTSPISVYVSFRLGLGLGFVGGVQHFWEVLWAVQLESYNVSHLSSPLTPHHLTTHIPVDPPPIHPPSPIDRLMKVSDLT